MDRLVKYYERCKFVHNDIKLEYIHLIDHEIYFSHCCKSHFEYLGDSFGEENIQIEDVRKLVVHFYLKIKDKDSIEYLETIFQFISDRTLDNLKKERRLFKYELDRYASFEEFRDLISEI